MAARRSSRSSCSWAGSALAAGSWSGRKERRLERQDEAAAAGRRRRRPSRSSSPRASRGQMAERIGAVDRIARKKRQDQPAALARAYLATATAKLPGEVRRRRQGATARGLPLPGHVRASRARRPRSSSSSDQLEAFQRELDAGRPRLREVQEPDAVRRADHRVDGREGGVAPEERALVAAVIYNRLHARMPLGDRRDARYGLDIPPTEPLTSPQLAEHEPRTTRATVRQGLTPTPIANPGLASMQAAAHPAKVDYLYFVRKPDKPSFLHRERDRVPELRERARLRVITGETRLVGAARRSGLRVALAADAERGVRGARARLGVRRRSTYGRRTSRRPSPGSRRSGSPAPT